MPRIGILSDTHGNLSAIALALRAFAERGVELILHCGDIDDAATVMYFAGTPTHFVLGNCDHDVRGIERAATEMGLTLHGRFAELEIAGKLLAMIHGDDRQRMGEAVISNRYHYLFYGHTHVAERHRVGGTWVVNPGALDRARPKTAVVLDLASGEWETLVITE